MFWCTSARRKESSLNILFQNRINVYIAQTSAGTSVQNIVHWSQVWANPQKIKQVLTSSWVERSWDNQLGSIANFLETYATCGLQLKPQFRTLFFIAPSFASRIEMPYVILVLLKPTMECSIWVKICRLEAYIFVIVHPVLLINYVHSSVGSLPWEISFVSNVVSRNGQDLGCHIHCHVLIVKCSFFSWFQGCQCLDSNRTIKKNI